LYVRAFVVSQIPLPRYSLKPVFVHGTISQILLHLLCHYTLSGGTSRFISFSDPFRTMTPEWTLQ